MNDNYLEVLEQYEGEFTEVRRGRGAWICVQDREIRLLKEYRGTIKRLEFEETVLKKLREGGIGEVDQYVRNREGELLTAAGDGTKYVLKQWFSDRECNLKDVREILTAVSRIAGLHRILRQVEWQEEWDLESMQPPRLCEELKRHTREMKRVRGFVAGKRKKGEFEFCVLRHFDEFYEQALEAQKGIEELEEKHGETRRFLCHGDLNQHHILLGNGQAAFIEFNQMHRGEQMEDLYHFMRKVMEKHGWNEELGISMIDAYDQELSIGEEDRKYLYYLFLYPEKYWKQLNYYNNTNKAWVPEKNVEKLKNLQMQQEQKMNFIRKIGGQQLK